MLGVSSRIFWVSKMSLKIEILEVNLRICTWCWVFGSGLIFGYFSAIFRPLLVFFWLFSGEFSVIFWLSFCYFLAIFGLFFGCFFVDLSANFW